MVDQPTREDVRALAANAYISVSGPHFEELYGAYRQLEPILIRLRAAAPRDQDTCPVDPTFSVLPGRGDGTRSQLPDNS
jgi:hypothetical protein